MKGSRTPVLLLLYSILPCVFLSLHYLTDGNKAVIETDYKPFVTIVKKPHRA